MRRLRCGDAEAHAVDVRREKDSIHVMIDGAVHRLDVSAVAPGVFVLRRDVGVEVFHCVRDGGTVHLSWRGDTYRIEEEGEERRVSARPTSDALEAPMPGKVIKVCVEVGQEVAKGEEILVVEAMKMENALRAPRAGRIIAIDTHVGAAVAPGRILVQLGDAGRESSSPLVTPQQEE
jgi:biotin carboxyl carrier protein